MNFKEDDKGKILIEKAKKAINIDKKGSRRDYEIERAMRELYEHFSSYSEEELNKLGLQLEIFKVEIMLENEFLALNSKPIFDPNAEIQYPKEIHSYHECEKVLDFIVHNSRKKLSENFDLEKETLEKHCVNTSYEVEEICQKHNIQFLHLGLDQNMNNGMFHHFTIVNIPIANGESKMYLIDCTYRQFFTKSNSFIQRISVMRGPAKGCSIGAYMMMTEERKQIAEKLLTKGYIEATPQNIKEYFDAIIFSGRGYDYYEQQSLDFMNPNDCIPSYSITNYINMLIQNRVIDENSFFRSIENEKKGITTTDIGRRCINKVDTLSRTKISNIFKCWRNKEKENLRG